MKLLLLQQIQSDKNTPAASIKNTPYSKSTHGMMQYYTPYQHHDKMYSNNECIRSVEVVQFSSVQYALQHKIPRGCRPAGRGQ